ncbi:MAG: hypothetical protein V1684_02600 [bacterium]
MNKKFRKIASATTSIVTIAWMSGLAMLAPVAVSAAAVDGDLVRNPSAEGMAQFDIYIVKLINGKTFKRLILSPHVFESYQHFDKNGNGTPWDDVLTVDQATMDSYTTSELVRAVGDPKVYRLGDGVGSDTGTKQWLNMTAEQFVADGYDWDSIYNINTVDRDAYAAGSDIIGGGGTPSTAPGALTVALASDTPAVGVAVESAARVPFTKVNFTAGSDSVTITGLTIQRTSLSDDAVFSSVVLIDDSTNLQVGLSQTLNAAHQSTFSESIIIPANTTKSYTLAANMPASLNSYAGQLASLALVSVTTSATVSGSLPITGNYQSINATLVIGSATVAAGSFNPATSTKEVGTANYNFSGIKITAGSTEDVTVQSIRWNQSGSAASSDLANIVVSDGTTNYATIVSSDGKYYTASFGSGLVIGKGLSKEFTIKGDIVSGSARTISFDIYKTTDVTVKGNVYGYYMTPTSAGTYPFNNSSSPFFNGNNVTIGTGSLRVDKNSTAAPAGNITEGASGVLLGAFDFVVQGEPVNVAAIVVDFDHTGTGSTSDITNITLAKADGTILAGPVNGTDETTVHVATLDGTRDGYATFSGTVTFPVGTTQILVKGNLNTDFAADDTLRAGFNTPATKVTSVTGGTTGNSITTAPASQVWGNTMTTKSGSLTVTVAGTPVAQTVVRGITGFTFANYVFDASASGEDIRVTAFELQQVVDAAANDSAVTSMVLYDESTALNTGSNVLNPDGGATTNTYTVTLDNYLIIPKGTQKTIALKGNISGTATAAGTQQWGVEASATVTATGVSTGQTITVTTAVQAGQAMTIAANGQYSVALDASTPSSRLIAANTTGNTLTVLRFKATAEPINVTKVRLAMVSGSSTTNDLANVYIYDGSTLLGSGVLGTGNSTGGTANASSTFTLTTPISIPTNGEKVITIKADVAPISTTDTTATSGHYLAIDYYGSTSTSENIGTGVSSGASIANYSSTTSQAGAYIHRSVPTVAAVTLPSSTLVNSTMVIGKFKVTADAKGDIDLYKFTYYFATTSGSTGDLGVDTLTLYDVTEAAEVTCHVSTTLYADANHYFEFYFTNVGSGGTSGSGTTTRTVAAGTSRTFEIRGVVTGVASGASLSSQLEGDSATTAKASGTYSQAASTVDSDTHNDFIWADFSDVDHSASTSSAINTSTTDWYNGYLVSGLPSSNLPAQVLSQ